MHYNAIALTTLLASATASAIPGLTRTNSLTKRSEKTWDEAGNLKLTCKFLPGPKPHHQY